MKKILIYITTIIFLISSIKFDVHAMPEPPKVSADGAVLMDGNSGEILYEKNMDAAYPPASTTKLMTALLTLENCKLNDKVKTSDDFTKKYLALRDGNTINIGDGEEFTVHDLLYALLLISANDAAVALAEHISGSPEAFAKLMNKRAAELGCTDTNFKNPNGLFDKDHKTSAKDLALIMRELSKNPEYKTISTTLNYEMAPTNKMDAAQTKKSRNFWNEDKLVYQNSHCYYDGCIGGKAGYTIQSLHSFVSVACKNNEKLIVAFIHSKDKTYYDDTKALFDYGFNNYEQKKLFSKGDTVQNYYANDMKIPLVATEDYYYLVPKGSNAKVKYYIPKNSLKEKYFKKGQQILTANVFIDGKKVGPLKLSSNINNLKPKTKTIISGYSYSNYKTYLGYGLLCLLFIAGGAAVVIVKKKNRKEDNDIDLYL